MVQMRDRPYQQKKTLVKRFIRKKKTTDPSLILNEVNIDYDTLMLVLADYGTKDISEIYDLHIQGCLRIETPQVVVNKVLFG